MSKTETNSKLWKVFIIESESGWGQRVDEIKYFDTQDEANAFVTEYNSYNNKKKVPNWYMYAQKPVLNTN